MEPCTNTVEGSRDYRLSTSRGSSHGGIVGCGRAFLISFTWVNVQQGQLKPLSTHGRVDDEDLQNRVGAM